MVKLLGAKRVDLATGRVVGELATAPLWVVYDAEVACLLREGGLTAVDLATGKTRWLAQLGRPYLQLTIDGGEVFVAVGDRLLAVSLESGVTRVVLAEPVDRFTVSGEAVAVRRRDGEVVVASRAGTVRRRLPPSTEDRLANGVDYLLEGSGSILAVVLEAFERCFQARGLDAEGREVWKERIDHSEMLSRDAASGMYFYLNFETATRAHLLFTSHWSTFRHPASVVLRVADGRRVAEVERHVSALAERPVTAASEASPVPRGSGPDGSLEGLLSLDQVRCRFEFLEPGSGAVRWTAPAPSATHRRADLAWSEAGLVVAQYDAVASGARLLLLDAVTGHTRWQGEVEEGPPFERTPLFLNAWGVAVEGNRVLLIGEESAGTTAQVFDLADGRRIYSDLHLAGSSAGQVPPGRAQ